MKPEYTTEIHIKRLKSMIEFKGHTCNQCPASKEFLSMESAHELWSENSEVCKICSEFAGVPSDRGWHPCPCSHYKTVEKTFKITLEKIKEWEEENGK